MPMYDMVCPDCKHEEIDQFLKMEEVLLCKKCNSEMKRRPGLRTYIYTGVDYQNPKDARIEFAGIEYGRRRQKGDKE